MPGRLPRRIFAKQAGVVFGGALAAPVLGVPWVARARSKTKIYGVESGARGVTIRLGLVHGPFPASGAPYEDDTCLVFVPHYFRAPPDGRIDTLVHFHGHDATVGSVVASMKIREQLALSRQNVILIAPQGPVNASDSRGGKLEDEGGFEAMLGEVRRALRRSEVAQALGAAAIPGGARIGATAISAHSGGYRVAGACLECGGFDVTEVYLFDALYAARDRYLTWVLARRSESAARVRHKLVSVYRRGRVGKQCEALMREFDAEGVDYLRATGEAAVSDKEATRARVVFVESEVRHRDVMHQKDMLRRCLEWSCFRRRG